MQLANAAAMDHVYVEAPVAGTKATRLEPAFLSDFPLLVNYVARLTDRIDEAPGIACQAFRRVADRFQSASIEPSLRPELFRAATQLSREALRPRRWFRRAYRPAVMLDGFPDAQARRLLRRDTLQRALTALPFESRALILLRDFLKFSYDEVAQVLGISPRKLPQALDRSRAELSEIYDYIKF